MTYLLDSNVWVALLRGTQPRVASRFRAVSSADLRVCAVIVAELRYGCARSAKAAANRAAVDTLLAPYPSLPFDDAAVDSFVTIRTHLEAQVRTPFASMLRDVPPNFRYFSGAPGG